MKHHEEHMEGAPKYHRKRLGRALALAVPTLVLLALFALFAVGASA